MLSLSYFSIACRCPECIVSKKPFVASSSGTEAARTLRWLLTCPHQRSLPLAIMGLMLAINARADQPTLTSDLSVHGPTLDTRPLDSSATPSTGKVNSPDSNLTTQTNAVAVPADPLPQDNTLASNQTPDLNTPGASAEAASAPPVVPASVPSLDGPAAPAPGLVASTDLAVNNAAPMASVPSKTSAAASAPTTNATINLINLMVKRNLISRDDADGLIREAQQEADNASAAQATTAATAEQALTIQQTKPAPAPAPQAPAGGSDDEMRISYVPDVVKKQITDQVTQNVMEETRAENLADTIAANQVPEWVKRLHLTGDIRLRFEGDYFPSGNAQGGNFINFNAINTGSAINVSKAAPNPVQIPQYNVNEDRNRFRLRMRIGVGLDLGSNFTAGVRVATGSDDNPTTENQTLGGTSSAGAQGGDFAKYQIWLDRAFLRYEYGGTPEEDASITIGRFDNPWYGTTMMWANDLAFDGVVAKGSYEVAPGITPFLTGGAFPVFNTDFNFSTNDTTKFSSEDKYLFAVQGGTKWQISKDVKFTTAGGYYDFEQIQGDVSDAIDAQDANGDVTGSTDDSRPSFAQNGNTYIALRNYTGAAASGAYQQQYFGLASKFQVVEVYAQLDYSHFDPFHLSATGEFIDNVGFNRNDIINGGPASDPGPQNNTNTSDPNSFYGGNIGYMVHLDAGKVALEELWDWNVRLSYRYVQTDATVDAFTDSDFGAPLYGTNLKGYALTGNLALSKRVWLGLTFMAADNVAGPTFHSDVVQFDVNAKF
jgi:hypothetical protein